LLFRSGKSHLIGMGETSGKWGDHGLQQIFTFI